MEARTWEEKSPDLRGLICFEYGWPCGAHGFDRSGCTLTCCLSCCSIKNVKVLEAQPCEICGPAGDTLERSALPWDPGPGIVPELAG